MIAWMEQCRRVYNYALAERRDWMNSRKCQVNACSISREYIIPADTPYPDYYKQQDALTVAKQSILELSDVQSQVLQDALKRLDKAFRLMKERGFGFPRFKKYGQYRSFVFPQFKSNPVTGCQIKLPKIGAVPINLHRPIPDGFVVKQVRVVRKASGWYAALILQSDVSVADIQPHGEPIGIDVGLEKFLACSTGKLVERPKFFVDLQSKLRWLQRRLKNKRKGSSNYRKATHEIRLLHEYIHNTRREFHILTAHRLCDEAGTIFAEDLNLVALSRGMLAKHCLDAAWGSFLEILSWVSWKRGVYFARVDARGTSQTCPNCGMHTGKKELSERVHKCDICNFETNRDVAAAQVVMQRGVSGGQNLQADVPPCGCTAVGQTVVLAVEEDCLGVPMKQQTPTARKGSPRYTACG